MQSTGIYSYQIIILDFKAVLARRSGSLGLDVAIFVLK